MFWRFFRSALGVAQILLGPKISNYFAARGDQARARKRKLRMEVAKEIVAGVLAYTYLGATAGEQQTLAQVERAIEEAYAALVENGFSPRKARGIAQREVAKQLAAAGGNR